MASEKLPEEPHLYCEGCEHFVGYDVLENGDKVILCAGCSGECAFCHCTLMEQCFASLKVKYTPRVSHEVCEDKKGGTK